MEISSKSCHVKFNVAGKQLQGQMFKMAYPFLIRSINPITEIYALIVFILSVRYFMAKKKLSARYFRVIKSRSIPNRYFRKKLSHQLNLILYVGYIIVFFLDYDKVED